MSSLTQENRYIAISDFSLGKDTLLLTEFEGAEYISDLFEFQITVLSETLNISPNDVIGNDCTVTIQDQFKRPFNGLINSFTRGEVQSNNLRQYTMTMVPWLWFLTKTNNSKIFQEKNVKEILSEIFSNLGFTDFDYRAKEGSTREYCIQHDESDFHFVSRLMEDEGISYYFKHEENEACNGHC